MQPSARVAAIVFVAALGFASRLNADDPASPEKVFETRILPIFKSPKPSSCVRCHLAGVDLKDYILPSHEKTFLSLRDQGLIDLDNPERSKILQFINRGADGNLGAKLIPAKQHEAEYAAFAAWIKACAADPKLRSAPRLEAKELAKPAADAEVIRHGRSDRLLESFERNAWAWRFRCMGCHAEGTPQNDKHKQKHGPRVAWMKKDGAAATMAYLLAGKLIDADEPEKSLLLLKPLMAVEHEGGKKFVPGDEAYKGFRTWLEDVAAIKGGKYAGAADLPPKEAGPLRFGTDLWLKLADTPPAWGDKLLQADVYAWDQQAGAWEKELVATSDRVVWGQGKLWQHNLTLLAAPGSERAKAWASGKPSLPQGRYLVKVYVDADGRLAKDWRARLGPEQFAGQVEVQARWREGYNAMTVADAKRVGK
jgi:hypothetical protein